MIESNIDDLDIPISLRKELRSCKKHPISNFTPYEGLSPSFMHLSIALIAYRILGKRENPSRDHREQARAIQSRLLQF